MDCGNLQVLLGVKVQRRGHRVNPVRPQKLRLDISAYFNCKKFFKCPVSELFLPIFPEHLDNKWTQQNDFASYIRNLDSIQHICNTTFRVWFENEPPPSNYHNILILAVKCNIFSFKCRLNFSDSPKYRRVTVEQRWSFKLCRCRHIRPTMVKSNGHNNTFLCPLDNFFFLVK